MLQTEERRLQREGLMGETELERARRQDSLDAAFATGSLFGASEPELLENLKTLSQAT